MLMPQFLKRKMVRRFKVYVQAHVDSNDSSRSGKQKKSPDKAQTAME